LLSQRAIDLAQYRITKAKVDIKAAEENFNLKLYETSANRSYYAIFHAIRALLALEGIDFKKHSGVISHFRKKYINTKIFDEEYSDSIQNAFDIRNDSDYEDFFVISKKDVEAQIVNAKKFVDCLEVYVDKILSEHGNKKKT